MKTRFLQFVVDSETRQLMTDGKEIHLSPKAFDLLCALVSRRPGVVGKNELLAEIWPDTHVAEANLNVLVGEVRRALADNAQRPRWIRTVHGVGFAFCGEAQDIEKESAARFWLLGKERNFQLSEGDNVVGRDPSCAVWIDDPDVSRRHACIHVDATHGSATLADLDSTNGTHLGRSRVKSQKALHDGDVIKVGPVELKFRDGAASQQTRRIRRKEA